MSSIIIFGLSLYEIVLYFFIYAFIGWCGEVIYNASATGKFINCGLLNGPICPIYGVGAVFLLLCLRSFTDNLIILFIGSFILLTILEYFTGFLLDKIFHTKWWDYTSMPFNINGYVCLKYSLIWATGGVILTNLIHPAISFFTSLLPVTIGYILISLFSALFITDLTVTVMSILRLNKYLIKFSVLSEKLKLSSEGIGTKLSEDTIELKEKYNNLVNKEISLVHKRILKAFPNMKSRYNNALIKLREKANLKSNENNTVKEVVPLSRKERPFAYGLSFEKLFWIFMIGCVIGVILETIWCLITRHHYENRVGVIYGPFNQVYGFGAVILTVCLDKLSKKRDLWIFLGSALLGGGFEYLCSFAQEIAFGTVSWEYSDTQLNLNGRTNVLFSLLWGILGLIWVKDIYPRLSKSIEKIPKKIGKPLTAIMLIFIIFDLLISGAAVFRRSQRDMGVQAENKVEEFLDKHYTDEFLDWIYPNMKSSDEHKNSNQPEI